MGELRCITIVDDHTMFRKGLTAPHLPDIVLLDISMPEMDGYATANWIRVNHPGIRMLALSTMDSETVIIRMVQHSARGYLLKVNTRVGMVLFAIKSGLVRL